MQWPPEDSQCYAWLPEPGTAAEWTEAEWTEGGFETIFSTYDKILPLTLKPVRVFLCGGEPLNIRGKKLLRYCVPTMPSIAFGALSQHIRVTGPSG